VLVPWVNRKMIQAASLSWHFPLIILWWCCSFWFCIMFTYIHIGLPIFTSRPISIMTYRRISRLSFAIFPSFPNILTKVAWRRTWVEPSWFSWNILEQDGKAVQVYHPLVLANCKSDIKFLSAWTLLHILINLRSSFDILSSPQCISPKLMMTFFKISKYLMSWSIIFHFIFW
jgi:hypothetical protein